MESLPQDQLEALEEFWAKEYGESSIMKNIRYFNGKRYWLVGTFEHKMDATKEKSVLSILQ